MNANTKPGDGNLSYREWVLQDMCAHRGWDFDASDEYITFLAHHPSVDEEVRHSAKGILQERACE